MTTQNELKAYAATKGYFLDINYIMNGKYPKKIEYTTTNPLGDVVYTNSFKWSQNAAYNINDTVFGVLVELPDNNFKIVNNDFDIDNLLHSLMKDDEPEVVAEMTTEDFWAQFE